MFRVTLTSPSPVVAACHILLFPVFALLFIACRAIQAQETTGSLAVQVVDENGRPLPEVRITTTGPNLLGARSAETNDGGRSTIGGLPAGSYEVRLHRLGYREIVVEGVPVRLGRTTSLEQVEMPVEAVPLPPLTVTASAFVLDPASTTIGANLTSQAYDDLPVDRDFLSVIPLLPLANQSFLGDGVNIAGATGLENAYFIDGLNVTDPYRGLRVTTLPYNFVKDVEVKAGGYEAEFGRALGGIVNAVTFAGGDDFEASGFGFFAGSVLSATPELGLLDAEVESAFAWDVGATLGGALVEERLWFFAGYNLLSEGKDIALPGLGLQEDRRITHMFMGKFTWRAAERTQLHLSVFGDPTTHEGVENPATFNLGSPVSLENPDPFLASRDEGGVNLALQARSEVGSRLVLDISLARYQRSEDLQGLTERARTEPLFVDIATGVWSGGFGTQQELNSTRTSARLVGTLALGPHTVKAGVEYEENFVDLTSRFIEPGLIQETPDGFVALVATQDSETRNRVPTAYLQNSWRVSPRWTVNAGLRWAAQYFVGAGDSVAQAIPDEFQPRLGFVFQPGELGRQKIFGSYGRFYQQLPIFSYALGHGLDNRLLIYAEDPRNPASEPVAEIVFADPDTPTIPNVPGLVGEHADEFTLGYERLFGSRWRARARFIYKTLRNAVGVGFDPSVGTFVPGNPGQGSLDFLPEVQRDYTALELTAEFTQTRSLNLIASYVLSRAYGNYTGLFPSDVGFPAPGNNFSLQLAEQAVNSTGRLPNDRPHVFKLLGSYHAVFGLSAGTFITVQSGTPLNEFGATMVPFRPSFTVERGSAGRTPTIWELNLRLAYDLEGLWGGLPAGRLVLDLLHVGNPQTVVAVDQFRYSGLDFAGNQIPNPSFGEPLVFQPPMALRLGFEVRAGGR